MISLRIITAAFLFHGDDVLMLKRSLNRRIAPGMWAAVGGHVEPPEMRSPETACRREIYEETGLSDGDIEDLTLRYIVLRRDKDEIRVQYIFFGRANRREVVDSDEGVLHWISRSNVCDLDEMTPSIRFVLHHYFETAVHDEVVYTGTVTEAGGQPAMNWSTLKDYV